MLDFHGYHITLVARKRKVVKLTDFHVDSNSNNFYKFVLGPRLNE